MKLDNSKLNKNAADTFKSNFTSNGEVGKGIIDNNNLYKNAIDKFEKFKNIHDFEKLKLENDIRNHAIMISNILHQDLQDAINEFKKSKDIHEVEKLKLKTNIKNHAKTVNSFQDYIGAQQKNLQKMQHEHKNNVKNAYAKLDEKIQNHTAKKIELNKKVDEHNSHIKTQLKNVVKLNQIVKIGHAELNEKIRDQEQKLQNIRQEHADDVTKAYTKLYEKIRNHKNAVDAFEKFKDIYEVEKLKLKNDIQNHATKEELYKQNVRSVNEDLECKKMNHLVLVDAMEHYHNVAMQKINRQQKNHFLETLEHYKKLKEGKVAMKHYHNVAMEKINKQQKNYFLETSEHYKKLKDEKIKNEMIHNNHMSDLDIKRLEHEEETEKLREKVYKHNEDVKKFDIRKLHIMLGTKAKIKNTIYKNMMKTSDEQPVYAPSSKLYAPNSKLQASDILERLERILFLKFFFSFFTFCFFFYWIIQ